MTAILSPEATHKATPQAWPADVPEPSIGQTGCATVDLTGSQAAAAVAHLSLNPEPGTWPTYRGRTNNGIVRAAVRYLLPHE